MAPKPTVEMDDDTLEAFKALVREARPKSKPSISSKFVKKMEEIPSVELSPEEPCKLALLLAENALIGKFTGLWPSPKMVEAWMGDRWKSLLQGEVSLCAVGRGFFVFSFTRTKDRDLVFRSRPYFMGARGLFLAPWTLDFNPGAEITAGSSLASLGEKISGGHWKQAWAFLGQCGAERRSVYLRSNLC